ncbi:MAG TPA: 3'-5' exonuclease [Candidatus Saccharimonadales bacterium]
MIPGRAPGGAYEALSLEYSTQESYTLQQYCLERLSERDFLIVDIEATGLHYPDEDIIEIATLPVEDGRVREEKAWSTLIWTDRDIPPAIQLMTGITNSDVRGGKPLANALAQLVSTYPDHVWVAQCGFEFDFPFLDQEHLRHFGQPLPVDILDTKVMYSALFPNHEGTISTDFLVDKYGVNSGAHARHRAGSDVALLASIFLRVMVDYRNRGVDDIVITDPITIQKFVPRP